MPFCPHCGNAVEQIIPIAAAVADVASDVEIARIQAERDIEVAKISARQDRDWNETHVEVAAIEAEAEVGAAEAEAEVIAAVLAESSEPEPDAGPIVINAPTVADDQADDEELPPAEGSDPPEPSSKRVGLGMW